MATEWHTGAGGGRCKCIPRDVISVLCIPTWYVPTPPTLPAHIMRTLILPAVPALGMLLFCDLCYVAVWPAPHACMPMAAAAGGILSYIPPAAPLSGPPAGMDVAQSQVRSTFVSLHTLNCLLHSHSHSHNHVTTGLCNPHNALCTDIHPPPPSQSLVLLL